MAQSSKGKVVDKWKTKQWYTVYAPSVFENKELGEIVSSNEKNLLNRVLKIPLSTLTGQTSQAFLFTSVKFRIVEVKGKNAYTKFIGHAIDLSYLKTLTRKGRSLVNIVYDFKTKDSQTLRLKIIAITASKVSRNTRKNIFNALKEELQKLENTLNFDEIVEEIIFGKLSTRLFNRVKQITEMKRVEIKKSELRETFK